MGTVGSHAGIRYRGSWANDKLRVQEHTFGLTVVVT